jgi:hypothetical protein
MLELSLKTKNNHKLLISRVLSLIYQREKTKPARQKFDAESVVSADNSRTELENEK